MALYVFFFQAEDGIRDVAVTGVQTCALPICSGPGRDAATLRRLRHPRFHWRAQSGLRARGFFGDRSEERRVGEEGRSRWAPYHLKKKKKNKEQEVEIS